MNGNGSAAGYRGATPNAKYVAGYENKTEASNSKSNTNNHIIRGHYSDAVLSHLESQNDEEVDGISAKVKMLKDVGSSQATTSVYPRLGVHIDNVFDQITMAIGDEIRDTTHITDLNDSFENTRTRIRGNMNRMLRMAERTGVGWKVWVGFFALVFLLFFYVWIT